MGKLLPLLLLALLICCRPFPATAEDSGECRLRCETENTDCVNQPPAADPEVQAAQLANCDRRLQICYAECESLKPAEPPGYQNTPNIIYK